jgi:transposase
MRRYGLRDDQWDRIKDILPGREGHVGGTAPDNRLFVEAVLYRFRTGIPWRDLPERFGHWNSVWRRFDRWAARGVWAKVMAELRDEDLEWLILDSTTVRAHPAAAGAKKSGMAAAAKMSKHSAAAVADLPPKSTVVSIRWASPSN